MLGTNKLIFSLGSNANTSNPWSSFNDQSGYLNLNWFSKYDGTNWVKTTGVGGGWASRFRSQNGTFYFPNATADGALGSTITWQDILSLSNTGMTALGLAGTGSALTKVSDAGLFSRATAGTDYLTGTLNSANILVGNGSNVATAVAMSGDVTIANTGATTIQDNSVDGTDIALGSDAQGDVMYYNGSDWVRLAAGTSGQFLKTQGAGANPIWDAAGGGSGTVTSVTAGDGLTNTGTSTDPIINVVSAAGTAGSVGTLTITADAVGVALGTTNTIARIS